MNQLQTSQTVVVGVMKMGNIVTRVGLEPTSLAFWASVQPLHHVGSLMSPVYRQPPVYAAACLRCQCRYYTCYKMVIIQQRILTFINAWRFMGFMGFIMASLGVSLFNQAEDTLHSCQIGNTVRNI